VGLCTNLLILPRRDHLIALHRCDLSSHAFPAVAAPVIEALWRWAPAAAARSRAERIDELVLTTNVPAEELEGFLDQLAAAGLQHAPEPPSIRCPTSATRRAPPSLGTAPFSRAEDLHVTHVPTGQGYAIRHSSASSGRAPMTTVVETAVRDARGVAERLIQPAARLVRTAHVNRPANVMLGPGRTGWPGSQRRGDELTITPGPNPTAVDPAVWTRVIERLVRFDPVHIEGDPAYLAGLAHACLVHGVRLPRLRAVFAGHGHTWRLYRDAIRRGLGLDPIVRYHSSELGEIAIGCELGRLHLLDVNAVYEVILGGRAARPGQLGALVATTLDTKIRPLVRYVLGDVVRLVAPSCRCGKPFRIIEYGGRIGDLVGAPDRPVTYADVDAAIGTPAGARFFQLSISRRRARLVLSPRSCRELHDVTAVRARVVATLGLPTTLEFRDHLEVRDGGKLLALQVRGQTDWYGHFLGIPHGTSIRRSRSQAGA
jgi:phenylacetate-coenzyme A ligase PaaK-like adenylate-forming protein